MSVEGRLRIELVCQDDRVSQVQILSSRPLQLPRLFEGKSVTDLLGMVPMLYSVCGTAQASAAVQACRQAMGLDVEVRVALAEQMLVTVETAREHLWRILIDWPTFTNQPIDRPLVASLSTLIPMAKDACFAKSDLFTLTPLLQLNQDGFASIIKQIANSSERAVFSIRPSIWHGITQLDDFDHWLDQTTTSSSMLLRQLRDQQRGHLSDAGSHPLPVIAPQAMSLRLAQADSDRFIAAPEWEGNTYETSPLTRMASHPLLKQLTERYGFGLMTRMVARLLELASIPERLSAQLQALVRSQRDIEQRDSATMDQQGLGEVEAARGRLIHRAVLEDGVIKSYQILAPTEWNFHPRGVVAMGLRNLPAQDLSNLRQQAELFINAVDPCVGYQLEMV